MAARYLRFLRTFRFLGALRATAGRAQSYRYAWVVWGVGFGDNLTFKSQPEFIIYYDFITMVHGS